MFSDFIWLKCIFTFLVPLLGVLYIIPKLREIAKRISLIDEPVEKRKVHTVPVPLVGGIAIVISAIFGSMLFVGVHGLRGMFLGLALLLLVGFLDDLLDLDSKRKFLAQIVASVLMIYFSKVVLLSFGDLFCCGELRLPQIPWVIWPVTVFCVVGVINAINLADGLDGLAGGVSFIAFLTFSLLFFWEGSNSLVLVNLAFAGAVFGFLYYNWSPATVFMGDAGSLCLGFVLAFMSLVLTQGVDSKVNPMLPFVMLALPITDTIVVMCKRILMKRNPFVADCYHLHNILVRCGLSKLSAVCLMLSCSLFLNVFVILLYLFNVQSCVIFFGYLIFFLVYFGLSFFLKQIVKCCLRWRRIILRGDRTGVPS